MPDAYTLLLFCAASLALIVVPGPSVLYIVSRSLAQGRSAGIVSALGIQVGALVHVAAAALGVSALLASSATAFAVVKYAGAAYLIYIGCGGSWPAQAAWPDQTAPVGGSSGRACSSTC